jgi:hypothetical protein
VLGQVAPLSTVDVDLAIEGDECRVSVCGVPSSVAGREPGFDADDLVLLRALVDRLHLRRTPAGGRCVAFVRRVPLQPPLRLLTRA